MQSANASWSSQLGSVPSIWRCLEEFQATERYASKTIGEKLTEASIII
jgi:hypothetical protein